MVQLQIFQHFTNCISDKTNLYKTSPFQNSLSPSPTNSGECCVPSKRFLYLTSLRKRVGVFSKGFFSEVFVDYFI